MECFGIFIKENAIVVRKPNSRVTLLTKNSPWIEPILCGEKPAVIFGTWHMTCYSFCVARTSPVIFPAQPIAGKSDDTSDDESCIREKLPQSTNSIAYSAWKGIIPSGSLAQAVKLLT